MPVSASIAFLRLRCPACFSRFVPNYFRVKSELLIVCPHCFSPYVPQRIAASDRDPSVPDALRKRVRARASGARSHVRRPA